MAYPNEFINQISKVNPSTFITDENVNLPLSELEHNMQFIARLLSNSVASTPNFLSTMYGNLLDYDDKGNKVFFNGGNFDCYDKKHIWLAVDSGEIVNDTAIQLESDGAANLLVYRGKASASTYGRWLQRKFYIPPVLRGSELTFVIKGTGVNTDATQIVSQDYDIPYCNVSIVPNISAVGLSPCTTVVSGAQPQPGEANCIPNFSVGGCYARYEDIGIEIIGATDTIQEITQIGPWPSHHLYADTSTCGPAYRSTAVSFRVGKNTESILVKIRRTRDDGAIAISQMFLGGLPLPYENYSLEHLDINELYNFQSGITKWNASSINGRHAGPSRSSDTKLPNLLSKEQFFYFSQFCRVINDLDPDELSGPRQTALELTTTPAITGQISRTKVFEFDPEFDRVAYFDMNVDGPNPGLSFLGFSFFTNENEFSSDVTCATSGASGNDQICGSINIEVKVGVVNSGFKNYTYGVSQIYPGMSGNVNTGFADSTFGNLNDVDFTTFTFDVPIKTYMLNDGKLGYFEIYGDFYQNLKNNRGNIVYFTVTRKGTSANDTFKGNFLLAGLKTGIAVPPDDSPNIGSYNIFIGDSSNC